MNYKYVTVKAFDPVPMDFFSKKRYKTAVNKYEVAKDVICLDTETSHTDVDIEPVFAWVYQWAFCYQDYMVYGRKPSEMVEALNKIREVNGLRSKADCDGDEESKTIRVYIHNLSYDYDYIKEWLREQYPNCTESMIALKEHKLISWEIAGFEFRCSYKLVNKSLDKWSKEMGTEHKKLVGFVDYTITRYQDSELSQKDWDYMFADVEVLYEAFHKQLEVHKDDVLSVPLTSTGYVRRAVRKEYQKNRKNRYQFIDSKLNTELYHACKDEMAGGITHGNRGHVGETIDIREINKERKAKGLKPAFIRHRDFASHYPSQQMCYFAPVGKAYALYSEGWKRKGSSEKLLQYAKTHCVLSYICITKAHIKDGKSLPYLQVDKVNKGMVEPSTIMKKDNGRVLVYEGMTIICVNEHDLYMLLDCYDLEFQVIKAWYFKRDRFPEYLRNSVQAFFIDKTKYKDVVKELEKQGIDEYSITMIDAKRALLIVKGMLNGIFGMTATDPVRASFYEDAETGLWTAEKQIEDVDIEATLNDYYKSEKNFNQYQLGCWTTSSARMELYRFVRLLDDCEQIVPEGNFLYADTDSIFYLSTDEIEAKIEEANEKFRQENYNNGTFVSVNGKDVHFNQFELEHEEIVQFRFLHAKCYAYVTNDLYQPDKENAPNFWILKDTLHATIAGVSAKGNIKDKDGHYILDKKGMPKTMSRVEELGSIENLRAGFQFKICGGTAVVRNKERIRPQTVNIDGHLTEIASYGIIVDNTKTLTDADSIHESIWEITN